MLKINFARGIPNAPAHYNGAPGQDYLIARLHPETEDLTIDLIRWGLLPSWAKDRKIAAYSQQQAQSKGGGGDSAKAARAIIQMGRLRRWEPPGRFVGSSRND